MAAENALSRRGSNYFLKGKMGVGRFFFFFAACDLLKKTTVFYDFSSTRIEIGIIPHKNQRNFLFFLIKKFMCDITRAVRHRRKCEIGYSKKLIQFRAQFSVWSLRNSDKKRSSHTLQFSSFYGANLVEGWNFLYPFFFEPQPWPQQAQVREIEGK